jgi:hypothetical protein
MADFRVRGPLMASLALFGCAPLTDEQRYEQHLQCYALSTEDTLVRPHLSDRYARRLNAFKSAISAELRYSSEVLGKRPEQIQNEKDAYLTQLKANLSRIGREQAMQEAVDRIEECMSAIYE